MKHVSYVCRSVIAITIVFATLSCEDSVRTSSLTIDLMENAEITAYFFAELDRTQLGQEYAPNGTTVIVSVDYSELNPSAGPGSWRDTLKLQNGSVQVSVPVSSLGSDITFFPEDFVAEQIQPYGSASETLQKIYRVLGPARNLNNVRPGQKIIHEVTYSDFNPSNQAEAVVIRFQGQAIFTDHFDEPDVPEFISQGATITLYTGNWAKEVTVAANGIFEAAIPSGEQVNMEFKAQKSIRPDAETEETRTYRYTATSSAYSASIPVLQPVNFGSGSLWE